MKVSGGVGSEWGIRFVRYTRKTEYKWKPDLPGMGIQAGILHFVQDDKEIKVSTPILIQARSPGYSSSGGCFAIDTLCYAEGKRSGNAGLFDNRRKVSHPAFWWLNKNS